MTHSVNGRRGTPRDNSKALAARWSVPGRLAAALSTIVAYAHALTREQADVLRSIIDRPLGTLTGVALDRALLAFDGGAACLCDPIDVSTYGAGILPQYLPGSPDPQCPYHGAYAGATADEADLYDRAAQAEADERNAAALVLDRQSPGHGAS